MEKVNVGLVGYYGFGNYGDEYFKEVLSASMPSVQFEVTHGVGPNGELDLSTQREAIKRSQAILIGGGDLVIPFARSALYWRPEYLKRPVFIYGVGVPKWGGYDEAVALEMRRFFQHKQVKSVVARDTESQEWIQTYLKPAVPAEVAPDIVCAMRSNRPETDPGVVGLVLRQQANGLPTERIRWLVDLLSRKSKFVRLLILATDSTASADVRGIEPWNYGNVDIVLRDSLEGLTRELLRCEFNISMKFHGCVVSMSHNVPCLALSGANKFKNFYAEMGKESWVTSLGADHFEHRVTEFIESPSFEFPEAVRDSAQASLKDMEQRLIAAKSKW